MKKLKNVSAKKAQVISIAMEIFLMVTILYKPRSNI